MEANSPAPESSSSRPSTDAINIREAGNGDQPAGLGDDKLGFRPYVQAIYSYLRNPGTRPPFSLAIEGDWGSGKSSFMAQLRQSLEAADLKTVRFNAWRHDKMESMWAAFALQFMEELSGQLKWYQRPWVHLKLRWQKFNFSKGWFSVFTLALKLIFYIWIAIVLFKKLPLFSATELIKDGDKVNLSAILSYLGTAGVVAGGLFFISKLVQVTGNPFQSDLQQYINRPNYEGNAAFIEAFHRDFNLTAKILANNEQKVFIFIDDLDRADIPKAAELMQGLNMMISNSPNLIFIIGMDREKVAAGVAAKYKDLLPFLNPNQQPLNTMEGLDQARRFGHEFLEKFIQLSFQIPKPSEEFTARFIRSLNDLKTEDEPFASPISYDPVLTITDGADNEDFQKVTLMLADFFESNPRKIKQFVNLFRLKAHIANSTGLFNYQPDAQYEPLSIPVLGKFTALILKWPELVDELLAHPDLLKEMGQLPLSGSAKVWMNNETFNNLYNLSPDSYSSNWNLGYVNIRPLLLISPSSASNPASYSSVSSTPTYK